MNYIYPENLKAKPTLSGCGSPFVDRIPDPPAPDLSGGGGSGIRISHN